MLVKFMIDSPIGGHSERTLNLQSELSKEDFKAIYLQLFGVDNLFCSYEILKEGD